MEKRREEAGCRLGDKAGEAEAMLGERRETAGRDADLEDRMRRAGGEAGELMDVDETCRRA